MPTERRSANKRNDLDQTSESIPRSLPTKIQQETIKHNHQSLTSIPILQQSHLIVRLYLSHNHISNLSGIEKFTALQSINLSYNDITRIQELRKICNPALLKHLKIRMNPLPFGYEDYAISLFENLQTFQDIKTTRQSKQEFHKMGVYVSKNIVQFLRRIQLLRQVFSSKDQNKQNQMNRSNVGSQQNKVKNIITLNIGLIDKIKSIFVYPSQEIIRKMSTGNSLKLAYQFVETICQAHLHQSETNQNNFIKITRKIYSLLVQQILIKFSARNDKTLINQIHKIRKEKPGFDNSKAFAQLGIFQQQKIPAKEAKMVSGGIKIPSLINHPAKYIQKLDTHALKQHPINKLANWKEQQNPKTLIPLEQTKWHYLYKNYQKQDKQQYLFQQIPIFIYCKEYMEVITELILQKISQILQFEHYTQQNKQNQPSNKKYQEPNKQSSPKNIQNIQQKTKSILYKQGQLQNNNKVQQNDQEIELNLSQSDDAMSFGETKNNLKILIQPKDDDRFKQTNKKSSISQRQTKPKFNLSKKQEYLQNISNYTLYEINLAFKVFRSLKKRVSKRRKTLKLKDDLYQ